MLRVTHILFIQHSSQRTTLPTTMIIGIFALASYGMAVSPNLLMSSIEYHRLPLKAVSFLLQSHASQHTFFNAVVLCDGRSFLSLEINQQLSLTCHENINQKQQGLDLNQGSRGYEPRGITRLPHPAIRTKIV